MLLDLAEADVGLRLGQLHERQQLHLRLVIEVKEIFQESKNMLALVT
jgi:hypothetical protein